MGKPTKEFEYRMQGMVYALDIAKKEEMERLFGVGGNGNGE